MAENLVAVGAKEKKNSLSIINTEKWGKNGWKKLWLSVLTRIPDI